MNLPAVCGIKNHGNTCFLNSVIQCLNNIDQFAEYFVNESYRIDKKKHGKLVNLKKTSGSDGEVSDALAILLRALWTGRYSSDLSLRFKTVLGRLAPQYEGWDQHDAQELLLWILDRTHEELNIALANQSNGKSDANKLNSFARASLPRVKSPIGSDVLSNKTIPKSDEELARETLDKHLKQHHSFIHDLFQAQLKSCLTCRCCGKTSNTFDPFLLLSIPVPNTPMHSILVTVNFLDRIPKQVKLSIGMESSATLRQVRDKISRLIRVPERNLVLLRLDAGNGLRELIRDTTPLIDLLHDLKEMLVVETPKTTEVVLSTSSSNGRISVSPPPTSPSSSNSSSSMLTLVLVNQEGFSPGQLFGPLFSCCLPRDSSYFRIQMEILKTIRCLIRPNFRIRSSPSGFFFKQEEEEERLIDLTDDQDRSRNQRRPSSPLNRMFKLRVVSANTTPTTSLSSTSLYLPSDVEHPLFMPVVDEATAFCEEASYRGPLHLMLVVEWSLEARDQMLVDLEEMPTPEEDASVSLAENHSFHVNLLDCLDLYFREEKLGLEDAWMCPNCKTHQPSLKKLSLWSMPDILILHLKRFKQTSSTFRSKLTTPVDFPVSQLDMTPYLEKRDTLKEKSKLVSSETTRNSNYFFPSNEFTNHTNNKNYSSGRKKEWIPSPWQRRQKPSIDSGLYDLIAVCNHSGGLQSGHYTASCKNPVDKHWYSFDDSKVYPMRENHVVSSNAYILFYQRRVRNQSSSPSSSSSGYSSNGVTAETTENGLHWIHKINQNGKERSWNSLTPVLSEFLKLLKLITNNLSNV